MGNVCKKTNTKHSHSHIHARNVFRIQHDPLIAHIFFFLLMALHFRFCYAQSFGVNASQKCIAFYILPVQRLHIFKRTHKNQNAFAKMWSILLNFRNKKKEFADKFIWKCMEFVGFCIAPYQTSWGSIWNDSLWLWSVRFQHFLHMILRLGFLHVINVFRIGFRCVFTHQNARWKRFRGREIPSSHCYLLFVLCLLCYLIEIGCCKS